MVGSWINIVGTFKKNDKMSIYVNNIIGIDSADNLDEILTLNSAVRIGQSTTDLKGLVDEVRISDSVRSPAWVGTSYETQIDNLLYVGEPITTSEEASAFTVFAILGFMLGICAIALVVANKNK